MHAARDKRDGGTLVLSNDNRRTTLTTVGRNAAARPACGCVHMVLNRNLVPQRVPNGVVFRAGID